MTATTANRGYPYPQGSDFLGDTAAHIQALAEDVDADLAAILGAWSAWTPSARQAITVGNGTETARYRENGKLVHVRYDLTLGSTSAVGTDPNIALPVTQHAAGFVSGSALYYDASADLFYVGGAVFLPNILVPLRSPSGRPTSTLPFTWATGDRLVVNGTYERA